MGGAHRLEDANPTIHITWTTQAQAGLQGGQIILQLLWGVVYYFFIIKNYPMLTERQPTEKASDIQNKVAFCGCLDASCDNMCLSLCCFPGRQAQTMHSTGVMDYWPSLILMVLCPFCTLCYTNSCTPLNEKLGGKQQ